MTWYFNATNEEVTPDKIEGYYGFVYCITEISTGKKYIGRKYFTKSKIKQVQGKKKKLRISSDWENYYGSNKELLQDILTKGKESFTREILHLCKTRSETNYYETWEIFSRHALLNESYYNQWVSCKITKKHLLK